MRLIIAVFVASLLLAASPADARVQRDIVCWVPDCEFPVDCDEEE